MRRRYPVKRAPQGVQLERKSHARRQRQQGQVVTVHTATSRELGRCQERQWTGGQNQRIRNGREHAPDAVQKQNYRRAQSGAAKQGRQPHTPGDAFGRFRNVNPELPCQISQYSLEVGFEAGPLPRREFQPALLFELG